MHSHNNLRWIPGTLDRVHLQTPHGSQELSVAHVRRLLGREALEGLYLRGSYTVTDDALDRLSEIGVETFRNADAAD